MATNMENTNKSLIIITLLIGILFLAGCKIETATSYGIAKKFSSSDELKSFLKERQSQGYYGQYLRETLATATPTAAGAEKASDSSSIGYSTTNIQVEGVDEADIIKNDGKYIYKVSNGIVYIIEAYPADDMEIISSIDANGSIDGIFINKDKLIVFGRENYYYQGPMPLEKDSETSSANSGAEAVGVARESMIFPPIYYSPMSFIKVYDISDIKNPELFNTISYDGDYYNSRMIGNYVYAVINQPIMYRDDVITKPAIKENNLPIKVMPEEIYYFDIFDDSYRLTTIIAFDVNDDSSLEKKSFLTGYTQNIFVSKDNVYLTSQKYIPYTEYQERVLGKVLLSLVDSETSSKINNVLKKDLPYYDKQSEIDNLVQVYYNKLSEEEKKDFMDKVAKKTKDVETEIQKETQKTVIHKISIDKSSIEYKARGEVPGIVLNQFSMDEYKDNFRIATTTGEAWSGTSLNHLYVLDKDLSITGKLEDLGAKEKIYSVRFMQNRAYIVTFKNTDPLFVIDLKDPENPKLLGELKIPGYSNYLHPYDETHIIGLGKEAIDMEDTGRDFALYQGIKLALFDVSDPENPKEISKFNIGDRGTDSEALYEHKAFLFDKEKELLVLPITLRIIDSSKYQGNVPPSAYGEEKYIGAYVFSLNLEDGFKLKGRVSHLSEENLTELSEKGYYYDYHYQIRRSLYIDNILYTISDLVVKANSLENLKKISYVKIPYKEQEFPIITY